MKHRDPRQKVLISARMRCGATWSDACILNLSSRGMLVQSPMTPSRGSYLEIRRGTHVIVARVVWASANRFGIRTQDLVPAESLIRDPDGVSKAARDATSAFVERRSAARPRPNRHEASRWKARALEFCAVGFLGAIAAYFALGTVSHSLARPLAAVGLVLER